MKSRTSFLSSVLLTLALALPITRAAAATPANDVMKSMQEAKETAYQLSESADRLHAITRSGDHSWQSHSWYLDSVREDVNQLGKMLSKLENLKTNATATQQMGIERMRPQLVQTADSLTDAIDLLNERRHHIYLPEYGEAVETVSQQATSMHQTLDAVLDYESAKARLEGLEMSSGS